MCEQETQLEKQLGCERRPSFRGAADPPLGVQLPQVAFELLCQTSTLLVLFIFYEIMLYYFSEWYTFKS